MLDPSVRKFVEYQIRRFPENSRQLNRLKIPEATPEYILQLQLSVNAVSAVYNKLSEEDKELLRLMYWSERYSADGIAYKLNLSRSSVFSRLSKILRKIACRIGYINLEGADSCNEQK